MLVEAEGSISLNSTTLHNLGLGPFYSYHNLTTCFPHSYISWVVPRIHLVL